MKNSIEITTSKWRVALSVILCVLLCVGLNQAIAYYELDSTYEGAWTLAVAMAVLAILVKIKCEGRLASVWNILMIMVCSGFSFVIFQMSQASPFINRPEVFFLNWVCCAALYVVLFVVTGRPRISLIVGGVLLFILAIANYYIGIFRGGPLLFTDLFAAKTAMNVSENYTLEWSGLLTLMTIEGIALLLWAAKGSPKFNDRVVGIKTRLGVMVGLTVSVSLFIQLNSEKYYDSWGDFPNGYAYTVCVNMKMMNVKVPDGYQPEFLENGLMTAMMPEESLEPAADRGLVERDIQEAVALPEKPNIIAIMNESFSDMKTVGNFETTLPLTPFIDSLQGSSLQGNVAVSVFGGGTCDSEYSFLTGNTTAFLPANARPYQLYIEEGDPSLVSTLNDQGYHSEAIHPGARGAWNREEVYDNLGFERFYSSEDFSGKKMTRGIYVSDEATYDKIIEIYEGKQPGQPLFVFDVTIQNHGGYGADASDLEGGQIAGMEGLYPEAEQYFSLIRNSDQAFEKLVTYFSQQTEPTIIVMFGDHQVGIEEEFYEHLIGKPEDQWTLEEVERTYQAPYVIWANYPIAIQPDRDMSIQNLSSYLLEQTGLKQPLYNRYLSALSQKLPFINQKGFKDAEGNTYHYGEAHPYSKEILAYQQFLYNQIFDREHRRDDLFSIGTDSNGVMGN